MRNVIFAFGICAATASCKKPEVKEYTANLKATCYDCIVQYAAGPARGVYDTLSGTVEGTDTLRQTGTYTMTMKEGDALFFRACRIDTDTAFGAIDLEVTGDLDALSITEDRNMDCAVLNQNVRFRD
ncbi:MAG: hypothetical protein JNM62_12255 [Flavobacteriales bacterium]|nr:hypothetical protein [Flavobacteriales bacterium]